ncbi:MAG: hypothetical protein ABSE64_04120 [Vulcanimicrobiaceae bacterium]|jgi:hypothetical protein
MQTVSLRLPVDPKLFEDRFSIPVKRDAACRFAGELEKLNDVETIEVSMNDVVRASARHLYVAGKSPNNDALVDGWFETLRWHIGAFWDLDPGRSSISAKSSKGLTFTGEHGKFSAEMMAEGFGIKYLEQAKIGANRLFFFDGGKGARPDYLIAKNDAQAITAAVLRDGLCVGLETRARSLKNIPDCNEDLGAKREGLSQLVAVYFIHAPPYKSPKKTEQRTRLMVLDPRGEASPLGMAEIYLTSVLHYKRITSQIGLWPEAKELSRMEKELRARRVPLQVVSSGTGGPRSVGARDRFIGEHKYRGRDFNSILFSLTSMSRVEIQRHLDDDNLGMSFFYGIRTDLVDAIWSRDLSTMYEFFDGNRPSEANFSTGGDGVVWGIVPTDDQERKYLRASLESRLKSVALKLMERKI